MQSLGPYMGRLSDEVFNLIFSKLPLKNSFAVPFISRYFSQMDRGEEVRLRCENLSVADYTFLKRWRYAAPPFFSPLILKVHWTTNPILWQTPSSHLDPIDLIKEFKDFISAYNHLNRNLRGEPRLIAEAHEKAMAWQARLKLSNNLWIYRGIIDLLEGRGSAGIQQLQALATECPLAQYVLGVAYAQGWGVEKNEEKAVEWLKLASDNNVSHAQFLLGVRYVEKNPLQAAILFLCAALQNHREAKTQLASMYKKGLGVDADKRIAAHLYRSASNQNDKFAQYHLGKFYLKGEGVEKDYSQALHLFWLSAQQGFAPAQEKLAYMYANGLGTQSCAS